MPVPREEWPEPGGERPPDWLPWVWDAFNMMALENSSARDAAIRCGKSQGTLSTRIKAARIRYGAEFWPPTRRPGYPSSAPALGASVSLAKAAWPELRALASSEFGEAALVARKAVVAALESLLADPVRLKLLAPRDILDLAKAAEILARRADMLSGIVPQSGALPDPRAGAIEGYEVDLGQLGQVTPDHHRDVIEMASLVVRAYKDERSVKLAS